MSTLHDSRWATAPPYQATSKALLSAATINREDKSSTPSTLSAAAPTFSPLPSQNHDTVVYEMLAQAYPYDGQVIDDSMFAESMQTRPQDDLFADDFTPASEPTILEPATATATDNASQSRGTAARGRGRGRERGRGHTSQQESSRQKAAHVVAATPVQQALEDAPTGPRKEGVSAVRGDRQATGGVRKPKLSEAELAEKMARISIKNASLTAAHARAEADAASFADREAQAKVAASHRDAAAKARAQSERKDRQQMMGEREKNRIRKLKAMEGREWDAEKNEDDFSKGGRFDGKGFAGDQAGYTDGREYLLQEPKHSTPMPGNKTVRQEKPPKREEFPALPSTATTKSQDASSPVPEVSSRSWAEQVEASAGA